MIRRGTLHAAIAVICVAGVPATAAAIDETFATEKARIRVETFAAGLSSPWGLDFLPDGRIVVTEKPGRLRIVGTDGTLSPPIEGVPEVDARGQGGMLDVTLHPDFADNRLVYLAFSEPGPNGTNSTAVVRGALNAAGTALEKVETVFSQEPKVASIQHYGARIVFAPDGKMFVTTGDRSDSRFRDQAQDLNSHLGKVIRLHDDGRVPDDNPFVGRTNLRPEIWSYGHRNIQGAAIHPDSGNLWAIEHGPRGGDEINIPAAGKNYGWPVVSHGVEYSGGPVGSGRKEAPGMIDPIVTWTPVIAPGGMKFYSADAFPAWRGNLLISGLRSQALVRLELDGEAVTHEERLLTSLDKRIRDVAVGHEGAVYVLTDESDGEILQITPAQ
ncbi:MAG: PQQ-dependent sugar dehydrogenase [Rhodospirillaceae bacterium]